MGRVQLDKEGGQSKHRKENWQKRLYQKRVQRKRSPHYCLKTPNDGRGNQRRGLILEGERKANFDSKVNAAASKKINTTI